jgi:uncharacterized membrane protein YbhN (UPF0104 family)
MKKTVLAIVWFICLMAIWTFCGNMITAPNTFLVLLGIAVGIIFLVISVKTKCFTSKWTFRTQKTEQQIN